MEIGETLYLTDAASWRAWLEANHSSTPEIWLEQRLEYLVRMSAQNKRFGMLRG